MSASPTNPYAPPEAPLVAQPVEIDFRVAAVEESLRILEANPGRNPDELGVSLVLPADVEGPRHLRRIGRMTLVRLVLGIAGLLVGALCATAAEKRMIPGLPQVVIGTAAAVCGGGGILLLLTSSLLVRRSVVRALGPRYDEAARHSTLRRPLVTGVEDARTFNKMKLAPEDFACVAFDADNRRLILEGLLFRYVIQAADVLHVGQEWGGTTSGVQVVFRVGPSVVGITLQFDSVLSELRKQTIGLGRDPLLKPILSSLGRSGPAGS